MLPTPPVFVVVVDINESIDQVSEKLSTGGTSLTTTHRRVPPYRTISMV